MIKLFPMEKGEEEETCELIKRVFQNQVAPVYSRDGVAKFLSMLSQEGLSEMRNGKNSFVILAKSQTQIIGMVSVINDSHIALIFVDSGYQGESVGKKLIDEAVKSCLIRDPSISAITVSSSPNSKSFYESLDFELLEEEINEVGMRFTPMRKLVINKKN